MKAIYLQTSPTLNRGKTGNLAKYKIRTPVIRTTFAFLAAIEMAQVTVIFDVRNQILLLI